MKTVLFPKMKGNGSPEKVTQVQPPHKLALLSAPAAAPPSVTPTIPALRLKGLFFPTRICFTVFSTQIEIRLFLMGKKKSLQKQSIIKSVTNFK